MLVPAVTSLDQRLATLRTRLAALPAASSANWAEVSYELKPPASEAAVTAFELAHGVTLPEDYRRFVLEIADGGAGPSYGLLGLADAIAERRDGVWGLADPFEPPASCADWIDFRAPGVLPLQYDGCEYYTGLVLSGPERGHMWSYVAVPPGWLPVTPELVDADGAPYALRGSEPSDYTAWYDVMLAPWNRGRRRTFLGWYEAWVDDVYRGDGD